MSVADSEVWRRFLTAPPVEFDRIDYDVALGGSGVVRLGGEHELKPMWHQLLKKRVDAVGLVGGQYWICEVKPVANMAALGQVLSYDWLASVERGWAGKTRRVVVCGEIDADLPGVYEVFNVAVYVV